MLKLISTITCPHCNHRAEEQMPVNACQVFYECNECKKILRPKKGDCCVYCSYGDIPCPPVKVIRESGRDSGCCSNS